MDQKINSMDLTSLAMAIMGKSLTGSASKAVNAAEGQFQKLLEQRAKPAQKPAEDTNVGRQQDQEPVDRPAGDGVKQSKAKDGQADAEKTDVPAEQPAEDPLEQAKRLAEMGAVFFQPDENFTWIDCDLKTEEIFGVYGPDEYIVAVVNGQSENIPIAGLEPQQMEQLQQIIGDLKKLAGAEDPEADALLEVTDPAVDHSLGKVLERVVEEQAGEVMEQAVEDAGPAQEDENAPVELVDAEQAPERVFQDVKAAPIKVAEPDNVRQAEDVNEQIAAQVVPALEQGQTRVELQLTPEHLGTVKIEITQSENGSLHVAISAENSQTRNLLEKHSDSLQNLLAERSQAPVRVEVQRQEESQPKNPYDGHNGQNQQQQQQEQHRPRQPRNSQDFLHQLRLGLVDETWEER